MVLKLLENPIEYKSEHIWCMLTSDPLESYISQSKDFCLHSSAGAVILFLGTTRDFFEYKEVVKLSYECYPEMCIIEMQELCNEILLKYPGTFKVNLIHRINVVELKEISVIATISGDHRKETFEACEELMFLLKKRVPVWKSEIYSDGKHEWKENKEFYS